MIAHKHRMALLRVIESRTAAIRRQIEKTGGTEEDLFSLAAYERLRTGILKNDRQDMVGRKRPLDDLPRPRYLN